MANWLRELDAQTDVLCVRGWKGIVESCHSRRAAPSGIGNRRRRLLLFVVIVGRRWTRWGGKGVERTALTALVVAVPIGEALFMPESLPLPSSQPFLLREALHQSQRKVRRPRKLETFDYSIEGAIRDTLFPHVRKGWRESAALVYTIYKVGLQIYSSVSPVDWYNAHYSTACTDPQECVRNLFQRR